ncbi:MAG: AAA family ATPase [Clostridia bacterium]|nr:AAA family ATPase [Clostridia bacterium]
MSIWIKRVEITSFGKLRDLSLSFENPAEEGKEPNGEGIHLLEAPNESGKSTLASFVKFCLYGFANGRSQSISENEKKLFTPWESAKTEGKLWICKGDKEYRIARSVVGGKETVEFADAATGKEVPGDAIPGVALFGISEEVFARTLFLKQADPPVSKETVLAEQLQNIAVSPEEQISSAKAADVLQKARNELRARAMGGGILPKWEKEAGDLQSRLGTAKETADAISELRTDLQRQQELLEKNRVQREKVSEELKNLDAWDARIEAERLRGLEGRAKEAEADYRKAADLIASRGEEDSPFLIGLLNKNNELEQLRLEKEEREQTLRALEAEASELDRDLKPEEAEKALRKRKELLVGRIALGLCAAVFAVLAVLLWKTSLVAGIVLAGGAVLALAGCAVCFLLANRLAKTYGASNEKELARRIAAVPEAEAKRKENAEKRTDERNALRAAEEKETAIREEIASGIRSYRVELGTDFSAQLQELIQACQDVARLDTRRKEANTAFSAALGGRSLEALEEASAGAEEPLRPRETVDRDKRFLDSQKEMLSEQERDKSIRLAGLEAKEEDPALLAGKLEALSALIADGQKKYDAYGEAKKGIEEAADRMKSRIAPQIGERAGLYFCAATDGAYRTLDMDTSLSMTAGAGGVRHEADYLSGGTKDLAGLAKRLSLVDVLFDGEGVPVILDDAFGRLDDGRLTATARMLGQAAAHHQILIFTCCDREQKAFDRAGITYHLQKGL